MKNQRRRVMVYEKAAISATTLLSDVRAEKYMEEDTEDEDNDVGDDPRCGVGCVHDVCRQTRGVIVPNKPP